MRESHPNRWIYGGVLRSIAWTTENRLRLWNGSVVDVEPGDTVLALFTGAPVASFVGVLRNGEPVASHGPAVAA